MKFILIDFINGVYKTEGFQDHVQSREIMHGGLKCLALLWKD